MDKYNEILRNADRKYCYSELEKQKIVELLEHCNATDVRIMHGKKYEVYFKCDAMPGYELTTDLCSSSCARYYKCIDYGAAEVAECLINQEKTFFDFEPSDDFYFKDEVKSILKRYHGNKKKQLSDTEIEQIIDEVRKELKCFKQCIDE